MRDSSLLEKPDEADGLYPRTDLENANATVPVPTSATSASTGRERAASTMAELEHFDLDTDKDRVPVTILTGFLGAGKTTLFNHILTASHGKKIAVIQNEFGEVGIDDRLMAKNTKFQSDEEIVEVLNGCVCCSVRSDLVNIIKKLAARAKAGKLFLDGIVIETTGMADPGPVAQTFLTDPEIRAYARVDGVVTLVDAKHVMQHLDEKKADGAINESVCQVAFADRLLLNKVDLVPSEKELQTVEARLRSINAFAPIQRCTRSNVSVDRVLDIRGFDLSRALERDPGFLDPKRAPTKHDALVSSHSIDQGAARHLRGVKTGELDLMLTQEWIGSLLEEQGADIYRMKGVLAIAHSNRRFVFHAVHMNMDGSFEAPWADGEPRESKLVFIGKGLDPKALNEAFNSCLDSPELTAERLAALRFAIGDTVECNTGEGEWATGEIVQLMYRDDGMPPGMIAPYQVRLSDGECISICRATSSPARASSHSWRRSPADAPGSSRCSASPTTPSTPTASRQWRRRCRPSTSCSSPWATRTLAPQQRAWARWGRRSRTPPASRLSTCSGAT